MCKDECKKEAEDKRLVMSDEKCKSCEYLYECPYMVAEMNDIVEGN